jgi:hypothetical protein
VLGLEDLHGLDKMQKEKTFLVAYYSRRCHRQQARDLLDAWNPTYGQLLAMNDRPTYHLFIYTDMCKSIW